MARARRGRHDSPGGRGASSTSRPGRRPAWRVARCTPRARPASPDSPTRWRSTWARHGIRVNGVSPLARTRMSDMSVKGGYPTTANVPPETIAPLVVFLASDAAANVTGQIVRLQGNTLSLFSHPKPVHPAINADGWDVPRPGRVSSRAPWDGNLETHRDRRRDLRVLRRRRGAARSLRRAPAVRILCMPQAFKGTLSAHEAAEGYGPRLPGRPSPTQRPSELAHGRWRRRHSRRARGGRTGGQYFEDDVHGPLGAPVRARVGSVGERRGPPSSRWRGPRGLRLLDPRPPRPPAPRRRTAPAS